MENEKQYAGRKAAKLEEMIADANRNIPSIVNDKQLGETLTSLYVAESIGESDPAMRQIAYLSAALGIEGYISELKKRSEEYSERGINQEMDGYMDICKQLSSYCSSKLTYFGNGQAGQAAEKKQVGEVD